ncbi:MAG: hypothetical protein J0L78_08060 [Planctomycetes bacterium]|nr:hypothetical protein [Planctomycetota bacterium]
MAPRLPHPDDPHPLSGGMVPGFEQMLDRARKVTDATGCPVVGGIAAILHGTGRTTRDIDIYSSDFKATHEAMLAAGFKWNAKRREHIVDDVPVHFVADDSLGGPPKKVSTIKGIKVISLADLIRGKLTVGLEAIHRAKDIGDVVELIQNVPLKKDFAAKLPKHLRQPFKELVDQVHGKRHTYLPAAKFWKKYA